jgi:zinc protease
MCGIFEHGGIKVIHIENHDFDYLTFDVIFKGGSLLDPAGKEGLGYITARMMLRGTKTRTYEQIMEEIDNLGSTLESSGGRENLEISGDALGRNTEKFLEILSDVILNPLFPEEELEKEKRLIAAELKNLRNSDEDLARFYLPMFLFHGNAYGRPTMGTIKSISSITRKDCLEYYEKYLGRKNMLFGVTGAITEDELKKKISSFFASMKDADVADSPAPDFQKKQGIRILLVDKPERTQTQIIFGQISVSASSPDFFPLLVANTAFGGTFTSKLMREIREKRGWSYGAYSMLRNSKNVGTMTIRVFPSEKDTVPAIRLVIELLTELAGRGPDDSEIEFSKNYLINHFPFMIDTPQKKLGELIANDLLNRPPDFVEKYVQNIKDVTPEKVREAVKKNISADNFVIVMVCTADKFKEMKQWKGVEEFLVQPHDADYMIPAAK